MILAGAALATLAGALGADSSRALGVDASRGDGKSTRRALIKPSDREGRVVHLEGDLVFDKGAWSADHEEWQRHMSTEGSAHRELVEAWVDFFRERASVVRSEAQSQEGPAYTVIVRLVMRTTRRQPTRSLEERYPAYPALWVKVSSEFGLWEDLFPSASKGRLARIRATLLGYSDLFSHVITTPSSPSPSGGKAGAWWDQRRGRGNSAILNTLYEDRIPDEIMEDPRVMVRWIIQQVADREATFLALYARLDNEIINMQIRENSR